MASPVAGAFKIPQTLCLRGAPDRGICDRQMTPNARPESFSVAVDFDSSAVRLIHSPAVTIDRLSLEHTNALSEEATPENHHVDGRDRSG